MARRLAMSMFGMQASPMSRMPRIFFWLSVLLLQAPKTSILESSFSEYWSNFSEGTCSHDLQGRTISSKGITSEHVSKQNKHSDGGINRSMVGQDGKSSAERVAKIASWPMRNESRCKACGDKHVIPFRSCIRSTLHPAGLTCLNSPTLAALHRSGLLKE